MVRNHIAWMCHPLSGDVPGNIARAKRWLRWLLRAVPLVDFAADWILWCEVLDDSDAAERERGLRFDEAMIQRCDTVWLVGGEISGGMQREMHVALDASIPVVDLTGFGPEPPLDTEKELDATIQAALALVAAHRSARLMRSTFRLPS